MKTINFNRHKIIGDFVHIYINKKSVLIDLIDLEHVSKLRWFISSTPEYAYADINHKNIRYRIRLHNMIIGKKKGLVVDHINGNKLDNRRVNLRHTTRSINNRTTYRFGYSISKSKKDRNKKKFIVQFRNLGFPPKKLVKRFSTTEEAIQFRKNIELKYFGIDRTV